MAKVDLEFLGRQIALLLEGQREIKAQLAETASRDLMLRILRSFEGQVEVVGIKTELLRETLASRIKAAESRLDALEAKP